MTSDPFFETTGFIESMTPSSAVAASPKATFVEILLLSCVILLGVVDITLAAAHSIVGWISGYLTSVILGVPILGFHTQSVLGRFERVGSGVTTFSRLLRVFLVLLLVIPAFVNATRLAVAWSS